MLPAAEFVPMSRSSVFPPQLLIAAIVPWLAGCAASMLSDRDCMTRVMYFESNRSSPEGMLAVGTTVMNRLEAPGFPKTVCGVVGQPRQFADGVLDKSMAPREAARAAAVADRVLAGERHPQVGNAMFFHTAGYTFPYRNMHYVVVAGGNAFYEKRSGEDRDTPNTAADVLVDPLTRPQALPQDPAPEAVAQSSDDLPAADQD